MARPGHPIRQDRHHLPRRTPPRRHLHLVSKMIRKKGPSPTPAGHASEHRCSHGRRLALSLPRRSDVRAGLRGRTGHRSLSSTCWITAASWTDGVDGRRDSDQRHSAAEDLRPVRPRAVTAHSRLAMRPSRPKRALSLRCQPIRSAAECWGRVGSNHAARLATTARTGSMSSPRADEHIGHPCYRRFIAASPRPGSIRCSSPGWSWSTGATSSHLGRLSPSGRRRAPPRPPARRARRRPSSPSPRG